MANSTSISKLVNVISVSWLGAGSISSSGTALTISGLIGINIAGSIDYGLWVKGTGATSGIYVNTTIDFSDGSYGFGVQSRPVFTLSSGSATSGIGVYGYAVKTGGGTLTNTYGLYGELGSGGVNNYALGTSGAAVIGGSLTVSGGLLPTVSVKTASYPLTGTDFAVVANAGGPITLTLPATPVTNQLYILKNRGYGLVTIAVNGNSIFTDVAVTSYYLNKGDSIMIQWDGTYWIVI